MVSVDSDVETWICKTDVSDSSLTSNCSLIVPDCVHCECGPRCRPAMFFDWGFLP